jgi:hypothetical protein
MATKSAAFRSKTLYFFFRRQFPNRLLPKSVHTFALGIAAEMLCEVTNKALQRIARPEGERPNEA